MFWSLPRAFHVYGDLYWKDTFWTISFLYYNLSTIRGYHCIVHVFPHQCCGNYRSEVIDSLKMPNCNFNYYLHLKVTITTKKG